MFKKPVLPENNKSITKDSITNTNTKRTTNTNTKRTKAKAGKKESRSTKNRGNNGFSFSAKEATNLVLTKLQEIVRRKHRELISFTTGEKKSYNKITRSLQLQVSYESLSGNADDSSDPSKLIIPDIMDDRISTDVIKITPEGLAFMFTLEGCAKNLLLFLVGHKVARKPGESDLNSFMFNQQVRVQFEDYCKIFKRTYKHDTVSQALKELIKKNVIQNAGKGKYYLNPLILSATDTQRRSSILQYTNLLLVSEKDPILDFYPEYQL